VCVFVPLLVAPGVSLVSCIGYLMVCLVGSVEILVQKNGLVSPQPGLIHDFLI